MSSIDIHGGQVRASGERLAGTPDPWAGVSRHRYDVAARPLSGRTPG